MHVHLYVCTHFCIYEVEVSISSFFPITLHLVEYVEKVLHVDRVAIHVHFEAAETAAKAAEACERVAPTTTAEVGVHACMTERVVL